MNKIIIFIGILNLLLVGCVADNSNCCVSCNRCNQQDTPTCCNVYVVCDKQHIWDERTSLSVFDCECDNYGCDNFPSQRTCNYGMWLRENNETTYEEGVIHCSEILGKDRRCN